MKCGFFVVSLSLTLDNIITLLTEYIYCKLDTTTKERKIQIDLYTLKFVKILGCPWNVIQSHLPMLISTKLRVCRYHSFGPALHLTLEAGVSLMIIILNHLDKVGI